MSTILLWAGIGLAVLALVELLPGVRLIGSPAMRGFLNVLGIFFGGVAAWIAWFVKTLFFDHVEIVRHLFSTRVQIDPTEKYRE